MNVAEDLSSASSEHVQLRAAVDAIRAGNKDAYAIVIRLYQKRLFGLALMFVRDRAAAEDVVQEALVRAYTHLDRYEEIRDFYPWIATITVRLAQNWRRNRANKSAPETDEPQAEIEASDDVLAEVIADEGAAKLWRAVNRLAQGERAAVVLFYQHDMKLNDVAQVLGVTPGSVKTLLFRAREKLRNQIGSMSFTNRI